MFRLLGGAVLVGTLTACGPDTSTLNALEVPAETLTAIATRDFVPSATPRPPTGTPAPTLPPTETPAPTLTPTEAPVVVDASLDRISVFGAGSLPRLTRLLMLDARNGWAVSAPILDGDDHVLATGNAGVTWREVTPPQPVNRDWPRGSGVVLTALDPSRAWATYFDRSQAAPLGTAWVWRTTDGGARWETSRPLPLAGQAGYLPLALSFSDPANGWLLAAVGAGGDRGRALVLGSSDGGQSWEMLASFEPDAQACQYTDLRRVSAERGYLVAACRGSMTDAPLVHETVDGGRTWTPLKLVRPEGFPVNFPGTCAAELAYAGSDGLTLTVACRNSESRVEAHYLYSDANEPGVLTPVLIEGRLESAGLFGNGVGLLLVDTQPTIDDALTVVAVEQGGAILTTRRSVNWRGPLMVISASEAWALYSVEASGRAGFLRTTDGGATWGTIVPVVR